MRHARQLLALLAAGALAMTMAATPAQAAKPGPAPAPMTVTITSSTMDGPRVFADGMAGCRLTIRATLSTPVPTNRYTAEYWSTSQWGVFNHWETLALGQTLLVSDPAMMGFCGTDGVKVTSVGVRIRSGRTVITQATRPIDPPYTCVVR